MNPNFDGSILRDGWRVPRSQDVPSMPGAVPYCVELTNDLRISIFIQAVQLGSVLVYKADKGGQKGFVASESIRSRHLIAVVEFRHLIFKNIHYFRWQDLPCSRACSSNVREQLFGNSRKPGRREDNAGASFHLEDFLPVGVVSSDHGTTVCNQDGTFAGVVIHPNNTGHGSLPAGYEDDTTKTAWRRWRSMAQWVA